ncbi:DNA-directed RNA polymerases II, IV and V subunit 3-like [Senna tora]|uniref:DNA-directed RNA polymerases II, IV and V subunit 3-like n=1 Tax=Senna tora TaxID=362788 RepID=A0A835CGK2_9FABA|nr:DNA-directed RNA polymerases II, IV and V subunit 3-like [Senna tora]
MEGDSSDPHMPRGRILKTRDRFMKFELQGTTINFAQALSRIMTAEVPTIAVDYVVIEENTSNFSDSFLAGRLRDIPLTSRRTTSLCYSSDCPNCNGKGHCPLCSVKLRLNVKCKGKSLHVTSKDLSSSDPAVVPFDFQDTASRGTEILKLRRGQEVDLTAIARKGLGKDDSKWVPTKVVTYFALAKVRINEEMMETLTLEQKKEWVDSCHSPEFEIDPCTQKVVLSHPEEYVDDEEVIRKAEAMGKPGLVELYRRNDTFVFTVKTKGSLKASDLVMKAMDILKQRLRLANPVEDNDTPDQSAGSASHTQDFDEVD